MPDSIQPKLVLYFNNNSLPLANAIGRTLTHLNFAFLIPSDTDPLAVQISGNVTSGMLAQIPTLQAAGKKVMISFGGGTVTTRQYQAMVGNEATVAQSIVGIVRQYGFDGVDIDYEDSAALMNGAPYNGVAFASALTQALYAAFQGQGGGAKLISHAPQPPYMAGPGHSQGWNCYAQIWDNCLGQIDWLNMQYYNNKNFNEPAQAIANYRALVKGWPASAGLAGFAGLTPAQLVMGKPVGLHDAGSGYMTATDIADQIVSPLAQNPGIGGVMGWQYSSDPNGAWCATIGAALGLQSVPTA